MRSKWSGGALIERRAPKEPPMKNFTGEGPKRNRAPEAKPRPSLPAVTLLTLTAGDDPLADSYFGWQMARAMRVMSQT